jgi:hypothetical protein
MTSYSTANISLHGCTSMKLVRYSPDNAQALSFEIDQPGGPSFSLVLFDLPPNEASKIADLFGIEPTFRKAAA